MGFCEIVSGSIQSGKAQPATEMQPDSAIKPKGFRPVEQIDLLTGWQQSVSGRWQGVGLLDVLPEMQAAWGRHALVVEPDRDTTRLRQQYPDAAICTPKEIGYIVDHWPESEGVLRAKRSFSGDIVGGAA